MTTTRIHLESTDAFLNPTASFSALVSIFVSILLQVSVNRPGSIPNYDKHVRISTTLHVAKGLRPCRSCYGNTKTARITKEEEEEEGKKKKVLGPVSYSEPLGSAKYHAESALQ